MADGSGPYAALTADSAGILYGTTRYGGTYGFGTVYELLAGGGEKILHYFTGGWDGAYPNAEVILDAAGNIYGTTQVGGNPACGDIGCGVVFKIDPNGKTTPLHIFKGGVDGGNPIGGLIRDELGNLYGTAASGGSFTGTCASLLGCGVIFRLDSSGHESVLYKFFGLPDGSGPKNSLVRDAGGNLYGMTAAGGDDSCGLFGCGVVFKLDRAGKETVLYAFTGGADGAEPSYGPLQMDSADNLYGATWNGGDLSFHEKAGRSQVDSLFV